jgi:hypothetical protein
MTTKIPLILPLPKGENRKVVIRASSPLLGWLNWLNIPVAIIGLVFSILGVNKGRNKGIGTAGIIINAILIVYGIIRLIIGGGFI